MASLRGILRLVAGSYCAVAARTDLCESEHVGIACSCGIMVVEADAHNHMKNLAMRKFLQSKGYLFLYDHGPNAWYANDNFYEIYKDLVY